MVQRILGPSFTNYLVPFRKVSFLENYFVFVGGLSNRSERGGKGEFAGFFMYMTFDWRGQK